MVEPVPRSVPRRPSRLGEQFVELILKLNGFVAIAAIGLIFVFLFKEGVQAFRTIPASHFIQTTEMDFDNTPQTVRMWQPVGTNPKYSLLPLFCGSMLVALPATLLATLFGVASGIYLAEVAGKRTREVVKPAIELVAGIPSVVIGFFCLAVLASLVQTAFQTTFRLNAVVGAIGVAFVIIPVIATMTDDALRAVPTHLREGAHALGANRWETIVRVVLPAGASGVTASILLGMGRALGETMIALMATGNAAQITANPFASVRTMTATIAAELGAVPQGGEQYRALFLVGSLLFSLTFLINLFAEIAVARMRKRLAL
ncbi:MAG: phosphate ABC transporter permease subunit PstC [Acidobacteria bacterium]|nr:phosphate ABC transporter permease subunit PstC [Acidobacteriota bacterium]